ncbi:WD repeat and SOCS box-containing protein 2 [Triplophysa tibetana]|uniref:WD repeat and SOCS box-containing protein 2 n=1 Tax=Triplophysa tibetana TaxID=1572043 RepID=A0A5A9P529_9TELE|nr:WD repeat and SOCS box-containing protein 2 [Triplophysa tibetana]
MERPLLPRRILFRLVDGLRHCENPLVAVNIHRSVLYILSSGEDANSERTLHCKQAVWALAFGPCPSPRADQNRHEPDLLLAIGLNNGLIQVWVVSSAVNPHVLRGPNNWVFKCSISPDSSMIASLCNFDSKLYLWSMRSYTFMRHITYDHERTMVSCDFSPDGALLAVASYKSSTGWWLDLWDPYTADLLSRVEALQIWDVERDELVADTDHNRAGGLCCAFYPHGGVIATG